jgi:3-oxoacyl-[acyl-carrier protein] reductase
VATPSAGARRPIALVTGASRSRGIGAAIALGLAGDGWDVATSYWRAYDARMPWGRDEAGLSELERRLRAHGARTFAIEADLTDVSSPGQIFDAIQAELGPVTALVLSHCESVDSGLLDTTLESFERHFAVNVRASWLLIREFALRFNSEPGTGRIIALTSDHVVGNVPYGASKGALDRIVIAAAHELGPRGITANVVNPGATDTGWMSEAELAELARRVPLGRVGQPRDCANLVRFLCSPQGGWINGQLLNSNGGI